MSGKKKGLIKLMLIIAAGLAGCTRYTDIRGREADAESQTVESSLEESGLSESSLSESTYTDTGSDVLSSSEDSGSEAEDMKREELRRKILKELDIPDIAAEDYPDFDGSTATLPLSHALYRLCTGEDEDSAVEAIVHSKTTDSYLELMNGEADIILAYAPPEVLMQKIEECNKSGEPVKYDLGDYYYGETVPVLMKPIGRDALVFLKNAANPVENLEHKDIVSIYSGSSGNWKEFGGEDSEIIAFQRRENSGSQNLMEKLVMKGVPMKEAVHSYAIGDMNALVESVAAYDNSANAIGYSVYYYTENMKKKPDLELMKINGVMPSPDTIREGSYPYLNDFYAVIRADTPQDSYTYRLYEWLTAEGGQSLINALNYVGLSETDSKNTAEIKSYINN